MASSRLLTCVNCGTRLYRSPVKTLHHLCQVSSALARSPSRTQATRDAFALDLSTIPSAASSTGHEKSSRITIVLLPDEKLTEEKLARAKEEGDRIYLKHKFDGCSTIKQVQKLIQKADLKGGLPLEASVLALNTISKLEAQKSTHDKAILSQDFFRGVCRKVVNNVAHLANDALILSLESCDMFDMQKTDYLPNALIAECETRVTRGEFGTSELFEAGKVLGHIHQDLPVLREIAEDVAEKWEEVDHRNIAGLYNFLGALQRVPNELRGDLAQKTVSVMPRLSPRDLSEVMKSLTQLRGNFNSLSVFLHLVRFAYKYVSQYTDAELCDVLGAYLYFGHNDLSLTKALEQVIPTKAFTMHPSAVSQVMEYCLANRILSKPIFNAVAESFVYNAEGFTPEQIASQIVPFGKLNYLPPNTYQFLEKVEDLLMARFHLFPLETIVEVLYSFACVGRIPLNFVDRVFNPYSEMLLRGDSGKMDSNVSRKLTRLFLAVKLECPHFQNSRLLGQFKRLDPRLPIPMARFYDNNTIYVLQQTLVSVLGGKQYLRPNVMLSSGYIADFEIRLDEQGHVLPYENNRPDNGNGEADEKRIAVCVQFPRHFCVDTRHLLGRQVMRLRHLKLLGYQVIQVPYYEFDVLKTDQARAKYMHEKLFPTTYKFSW